MTARATSASLQEVRQLQLLLNSQTVPRPKLSVDGVYGEQTRQAVMAFQRTHGLRPDGVVGPKTRAALGVLATRGDTLGPQDAEPAGFATHWMDIALAELGVSEILVEGRHNARILEYHQTTTLRATTDETPWCSSFVNWVMLQAGRRGTGSAAAKSWLDWGTAVTTPTWGTVVVIKKKTPGVTQATGSTSGFHVGFFLLQNATHIHLLGGNQNNKVKSSGFALASYEVKGFRNP